MILEKEKVIEKELKNYSFGELLEMKREKFFSNDFYNCTDDEKKDFIEKNEMYFHKCIENIIYITGCTVSGLGLCLGLATPAFLLPLSFMLGGTGLMMFSLTAKFRKIVSKAWLYRERDSEYLKFSMFFGCAVKDDVLKAFIKEYSQSELVNLLYKKEFLTYKDLYDYIYSKKEDEKLDIKKQKIEEAVKCLAEK